MPRIHVTGPATGLERWLDAVRAAGWEPIAHALLAVEPRVLDPARLPYGPAEAPDWICVTSSNALPALRQLLAARPAWRAVPGAAVGKRTSAGVAAAGLALPLEPATDAADLARALVAAARSASDPDTPAVPSAPDPTHASGPVRADGDRDTPAVGSEPSPRPASGPARVLWLRGDRAHDLALHLRAAGLAVDEPVVYATARRDVPAPGPSDAVFLASPSTVEAWCATVAAAADRERTAIAIGATTHRALEPLADRFAALHALPEPQPEELTELLRTLA